MSTNKTKQNQAKPSKTKSDKNNPLYFEIPLSDSETMAMFTEFLKTKRKTDVTAVNGSFKKGQLFIGVLPDGVK